MFLTISLAIVDTGSSSFDARVCERSGAVIFPSERRVPSEDSAPLAQYAQHRSLNSKCPLVIS